MDIKNNRKKWSEALKSGKYKQGVDSLQTSFGSFCCLGVLCCVYEEETKSKIFLVDQEGGFLGESLDDAVEYEKVKEWVGLRDGLGEFKNPQYGAQTLSELNDSGLDFIAISKIIEQEPTGLFTDEG